jgi:hypothetical protein
MPERDKQTKAKRESRAKTPMARCGLCGKPGKLTRTDCCGQLICDDEHKYVLFSYARNSCHRNHSRYTLCGYHYTEDHEGDWRNCEECRQSFETEMYVWYGTNEFNFVKLENPPEYEPTRCAKCNRVIRLAEESYSTKGDSYLCERCMANAIARRRLT